MPAAAKKAAELVIRATKKFLEDPENGIELLKKVLLGCLAVALLCVVVAAAGVSLPSMIFKGHAQETEIGMEEFYSLENSEIYQKVRDVYIAYNQSIDEKIEKSIKKIQEDHKYTRLTSKVDPKTGKKYVGKEVVLPEIIKDVNLTKPRIQLGLAYVASKHIDAQTKNDNYEFDAKELEEFFSDITTITESISGTDPIHYYAHTTILTQDQIAKKYFTDEYSQGQYLTSYESFMDIIDEQVQESYEAIDLSTLTIHPNGMKIPHYLQYDSKWGGVSYGSGTMSTSACGPTSFAMVASFLTGSFVSPVTVANWSESNNYYIPGAGTSWGMFAGAASNWNINCSSIGKNAKTIAEELSEGHPVIASMGPGTFTKAGHFIVLRGITASGKILVNDPNDNFTNKNFYDREFDLALIMNESKNFWSFN